jgi:hypothetical protein
MTYYQMRRFIHCSCSTLTKHRFAPYSKPLHSLPLASSRPKEKEPPVCRKYLAGSCFDPHCPFSHIKRANPFKKYPARTRAQEDYYSKKIKKNADSKEEVSKEQFKHEEEKQEEDQQQQQQQQQEQKGQGGDAGELGGGAKKDAGSHEKKHKSESSMALSLGPNRFSRRSSVSADDDELRGLIPHFLLDD